MLDRRDAEHVRCVAAAEQLNGPMLTTWPSFSGAMYLLGARGGWRAQQLLWTMIAGRQLILAETTQGMLARMPVLMAQYQDVPMDLADASLVAVAEEQHLRAVFTLDADFRIYRLPYGAAFEIIP
jgi:predicted nucleic acid-binding protein